uniref:Uncharacterized protein n=1 Tax=viral metagenome TaxID=1070528 RepID=A0A6H1Z7Q8_9ZZZZ
MVVCPSLQVGQALCKALAVLGAADPVSSNQPPGNEGPTLPPALALLAYESPLNQNGVQLFEAWLPPRDPIFPVFSIYLHTARSSPVQAALRLYTFLFVQLLSSPARIAPAGPLQEVLQTGSALLSQLPQAASYTVTSPELLRKVQHQLEYMDVLRSVAR